MRKSLYILDGYYQIYRAFYAPFGDLSSPSGEPTRATHVFCSMLFGLLRKRRPDYLAVAMDAATAPTFRHELDENYKGTRDPAPEDLHIQADRIVAIVEAMGVPMYLVNGFEADDLMATVAEQMKTEDLDVYLVSRDKDLEQLITDRVRMYDASNDEVMDTERLLEKKGYAPHQAVEIQTLTGDSTDNIPGVPGIGIKTAAKLIARYGSAQAVLDNAKDLTPKMSERVIAAADTLPLTRQLVTLRRDAPLKFSLEDCAIDRLNFAGAIPIFTELGFGRLREQLDTFIEEADDVEITPVVDMAPVKVGEYHLVDTSQKLDSFVESLKPQERFAFDTETTGLNPVAADVVGLSFSWKSGEAYYIPVRAMMDRVLSVDEVVEKIKPIFEDESVGKIGQNIKYDVLVLRQIGIQTAGIHFDTMIANFLLDPHARSHSLDAMARTFFGHEMIPIHDLIGKGKNQITIDQARVEHVCEYASEDADFTWRLYEVLSQQMTGSHVEQLFVETEMPLVDVLAEMEHNGISLRTDLLKEIGEVLADRMIELTKRIHEEAGHSFNIDSTKQLAAVLFDEQGLDVVRKTKTGRSTDADTLQVLQGKSENPIPPLVLEYREHTKLKNTYVDTLPKMICQRTGRLHASFDQTGVATGRLSSRDPNLQNIPVRTETGRRIREAFVAGDADSVLMAADYSQIELRLLAHFCQDEALCRAFAEGQDIHRTVAADVNGITLDKVSKEQRSAAKAVNFGIIYGQSAFGLARGLGIAVGEAKAFIDAYFERFPAIRTFIDECVEVAKSKGYAETILGRRRPIPQLQSRNKQQATFGERLAVNTVVQGSAADLIKRAMLTIHRGYKSGEHSAKMLIQVHDELVFEVPKADADAARALIRDRMEHAIELEVPVVVDIAQGPTWADCK